jgi:hypothetical protein
MSTCCQIGEEPTTRTKSFPDRTSALQCPTSPASLAPLSKADQRRRPGLGEALERAKDEGLSHVILDGTVIPADRCREKTLSVCGEFIDVWYSGKAHAHGGNIQVVIAPSGLPLWVSAVEPGSVHDITVARIHALPGLYRTAADGLPTLADPGYNGAGIGGCSHRCRRALSDLGAGWERRNTASCGQTRSDALIAAIPMPLTCMNVR